MVPAAMGALAAWRVGLYAPAVLRVIGAALGAVIALDALVRLPGAPGPMAVPALVARDTLRSRLVGRSGRTRRVGYALWAGAIGLAVAAWQGPAVWWPASV